MEYIRHHRALRITVRSLVLIVAINIWFSFVLADEPKLKGSRMLGIKVNIGEAGDFNQALIESLVYGNETQVLPLDWNQLETSPNVFAPRVNYLAIANNYYPAMAMPVHLSLRPVHTNQKVVPEDLKDKPLNHPETIQRFKNLLDWIAVQIPRLQLMSLNIGSEIDIFLWGDESRWQQWIQFYAEVSKYARQKFPGTLIACETTHNAFTGPDLPRLRSLHKNSDAIGVSYYPMKAGLKGVNPPESVSGDFAVVTQAITDKPVIYYQIGYPSSPKLGSTTQIQAEFIRQVFRAWDKYADSVLMLNIQWMHETSPEGLDYFTDYYQFDSPEFRYFLGSIGLKSWSGKQKPAWQTLKEEARSRGFGLQK